MSIKPLFIKDCLCRSIRCGFKNKPLSSIRVNTSGTPMPPFCSGSALISKDHVFASKVELSGYPSGSVLTPCTGQYYRDYKEIFTQEEAI